KEHFICNGDLTPLGEIFEILDESLGRMAALLEPFAGETAEAESLLRRIRQARFELEFIVSQSDVNYIYWIERKGRGFYL
ncbi:hypothetical protein OFC18_33130, partial [Escherichia coli]|nr:hypothetical protein [Escherichia coli]